MHLQIAASMACMSQNLLPLQLHSQEETALQAKDRKAAQKSHATAPWGIRGAHVVGHQAHVKLWAYPAPLPLPLRLPFWLDWKPAGNTGVPAATPRAENKLQPGLHPGLLVLLGLLTHAKKECTHQPALPCGTRHLISPELAGKDVMALFTHRLCGMHCVRNRK